MAKKITVDESLLVNNPFANDLVLRASSMRTKESYINVEELKEGIITKLHNFENEIVVEKETFTKVYHRSAFRLDIFSRTEKARSLFLWLIYEINPGKDYIKINKERYMKEATVSINTYKAALEELALNKVITPTIYPEYYWINPVYFFSGNRLKKYSDRVCITPSKNNL